MVRVRTVSPSNETSGSEAETARTQRRRRSDPGADPERFEVCALDPRNGRRRVRVLATASTLAGARFAVKTLDDEGGPEAVALSIRDAATGRWVAG